MPKIGKWKDPKKYLPTPGKTCFIKTGDYDYRAATLEACKYEDKPCASVIFRDWSDNQGGHDTSLNEVISWAYIILE